MNSNQPYFVDLTPRKPATPTDAEVVAGLRDLIAHLEGDFTKARMVPQSSVLIHGESLLDALRGLLDGREVSGIDPAFHEVYAGSALAMTQPGGGGVMPRPLMLVTVSMGWAEAGNGRRNEDAPWCWTRFQGTEMRYGCDRCGRSGGVQVVDGPEAVFARLNAFAEEHSKCVERAKST